MVDWLLTIPSESVTVFLPEPEWLTQRVLNIERESVTIFSGDDGESEQ